MVTVFLNTRNEEHNFQSFYTKFLAICNEHRESKRALLFAFILYDFENAQISKVLKDTDYWLSLNEISGKYLTVFSLHYKPIVTYKPERNDFGNNSSDKLSTTYSTMVTDFHNPSKSSNLLIEKYFGKDIQVTYPAVLFFQTDKDKVIGHTLIELDEQQIEQSFLELKTYIAKAVEALKLIENDYKGKLQDIFENVKNKVEGVRFRKTAAKGIKTLTSITELASAAAGLGK